MARPAASDAPAVQQHPVLSTGDIRSILIGILLAMLLGALDQTIIATALPTMGRELGDVDDMPWVVTAYLLAATAVTPLYGKFSDIHGRRVALLIAIVTFVAGSVACALAPSMLVLILARGLQGLGGGGLISLGQTIIADMLPPRERARYQVWIASVFMSSSLAGPVLGGFFAEHLHWSMIFWINLPLGIAAYLIAGRALKRLPRNDRPHRLDLTGAVLMAGATVTVMLGLSWGGVRMPWSAPPVLGIFAASAALWLLFAVRVAMAEEPLIPVAILKNGVVLTGTAAACFGMGTFIGLSIYLPIYFEVGLGLSSSASGLAVLPLMICTVVGATIGGRAMSALKHYKRVPIAGMTVAVAATVSLALGAATMPLWMVCAISGLIGAGLGTLLPVTTVAIQNAVEMHHIGTATGVMNFFRQLGGALIVAAFGAVVLADTGAGALAGRHGEGAGAAGLSSGELMAAFPHVFAAAAAGFVLAFAFLLAMAERPLRGRGEAPPPLAD
ncbi:MDR family MFS transporter [Pseudoxanthobacter sp.]|uniref:MDR family MFS transporter n=1 Tax=Pseudoxanthobacter sp. TaxID=1925742 RepID=UPI002FE1DC11